MSVDLLRRLSLYRFTVLVVTTLTLTPAQAASGDARAAADMKSDPPAREAAARARPPVAEKVPHTTELHGDRLVDDYFWLRERESEEVLSYLRSENAYTEAMTGHTEALRKTLYEEMVGRIQETDLSVPVRKGDYHYYSRTEEGKQYAIYCRKKGSLDAEEEVLLDLNALAEGHDYYRLGIYEVSPSHDLLAYAVDTDGSERYTLHIKELRTGTLLPDTIEGLAYSFEWGNDDQTIFYTTRDHAQRPHQVHRYVLGGKTGSDEVVYRDDDERFYVDLGKTRDGRYLIAASGSSETSEMSVLDADRPGEDFEIFVPREQGVEYYLDHHEDRFYVRTNEDAKSYRLASTALGGRGDRSAWREEIAHRPRVKLEGVSMFAHHMVMTEREAGLRRMVVRDLKSGDARPVALPESVYAVYPSGNPEFDTRTFRFQYMSPITPRTVFEVDMQSGERTLLKQDEVLGGFDPAVYETQRVFARARDGMAVPVTLLYRKGLVRDGSNPCLLYGYGSYGASLDPSFSSTRLSLVDRGFVFALANIRGGGELGESWHDQGKMLQKRNTFTDFIDVAEYLVDQRYTSPEGLVIQGGSAGGLLVGAAVNMRPDLFRAVVAQVPFVDVINTMLDESIPLTVGEFEEWGNPKDETYYRYMKSYSPYDNVEAKDYPRMLITAGLNDPRVQYWEPAKWAAKLRSIKTNDTVLLLKTNMGAGHGGASGRYSRIEELAFVYAFVLDSVGLSS